jgi:LuxR family maltose regulon positive regulatory protein
LPKTLEHTIIWEEEHQQYQLSTHGQPQQEFHREDEAAFSRWIARHSSFAFVGQAGRLSVLHEARGGGTGYWYAYCTRERHTHKRYLGSSDKVTLARLEQEARVLNTSSSLPTPASVTPSLSSEPQVIVLSAKLSAPRVPLALVVRSRLLQELENVSSHRLTLLCAPAGSGKTTLLSAWAASQRNAQGVASALAWLSLDALDNDLIRFWNSVIAALRTCLPGIGEEALALLHSRQSPPLPIILMTFLNELPAVGREIVLILDDYHVIEDQTIEETVRFLIEHMPDLLHLVLISRTEPTLPLARLRVRSQVLELRADDLHFTRAETTSFLTEAMHLPLTEEDVTILQERTEGWIAGLQLAALSLRKQDHPSAWVKDFGGSHRYLLDYIHQEILARLPIQLQHFLLQTSILSRMNASLCQAVTASPGELSTQEILQELEQANLFVVPLDDKRQWYRYHDLFREALLVRLQTYHPELIPLLHQRAASFYEAQGELREAITHALAAADYVSAARLMERAVPVLLLSGEAHTMHSWIATFPDRILWQYAHLALTVTLRLLESLYSVTDEVYNRTRTQVEHLIGRLEAMLHAQKERAGGNEGDETDTLVAFTSIKRRLRLLRAWIETRALLRGNETERLSALARELEALGQDEEIGWNMIAYSITFWLVEGFQREGALLIPWLLQIKQQTLQAGDWLASVRVREWLAFAYIRAGQWHQVERECLAGLALVEQSGGRTAWAGYLYYFLGCAYYAWNRLDEAADAVQHMLRIAQDWQQVDLLMTGYILLARLEIACGNPTAADQALQQAEALTRQAPIVDHALVVAGMRALYWVAVGNLEAARRWADQAVFSRAAWKPRHKEVFTMWIGVSLALRQYTRVLEWLEQFRQQLDRPGCSNIVMEYLASYAVALHQVGKQENVQTVMTRLLAMTEPEGSLRVYLNAGQPMKQILQTLLTAPRDTQESIAVSASFSRSYVRRLLAAFEPQTFSPAQQRRSADASAPHAQEPLSPQEVRVLRLLVAGNTYAEIARTLIVSPNTIKTQVGSIYRKLGVSRRAQAIDAAARLHLLSSLVS